VQLVLSAEVPHAAGVPLHDAVLDHVQPLPDTQLAWAAMLPQVSFGVPLQLPDSLYQAQP